jgi:serine/threonine-protein kinase
MQVCPSCFGLYGPDQTVCPKDGSATENHTEVLIGRQLGPYVVRTLIGEGGMGVVYAGEHPALGKRVALKVLRPELSLRDDIVERFTQEARSVNTIGHSNIVNIYDFGRTPFGSFYIVMEFLDGQTLRSLLDRAGQQPLERVRAVVNGVGEALFAAHAKGFVHRDVKPENIMVLSRAGAESIKLLDFGIAKLMTAEKGGGTDTGLGMGTPQYMPPEQLEEKAVDHRADIYALAAVAYEMLTGELAFPGSSAAEVRQAQLTHTPVPPSVARTESRLSRAMDAAILWALNVDPAARCARVEDFLAAFQVGHQRTLVEQSHPSGPVGEKRRRGLALPLALGAVLALGVGGGAALLIKISGERSTGSATRPFADGGAPRKPAGAVDESAARALANTRVRAALRSPDLQVRVEVVIDLQEVGRPALIPELCEALSNPRLGRQAASALYEMGDRAAVPCLRQALKNSLEFKAVDVAAALARLDDPSGTRRLEQAFASARSDPERRYVLEALGRIRHPMAGAWRQFLKGRSIVDPDLRRRGMGYLAALGDEIARKELEHALSDPDWATRIDAARAMAAEPKSAAREVLVQALAEAPPPLPLRAAMRLAHLQDARASQVLLESLRSEQSEQRRQSALGLGRLGLKENRAALAKALDDPSPAVALAAASALLAL